MNWDGVTIDATILGAKLRRVNALRANLTSNPHPIHCRKKRQQIRADANLIPSLAIGQESQEEVLFLS